MKPALKQPAQSARFPAEEFGAPVPGWAIIAPEDIKEFAVIDQSKLPDVSIVGRFKLRTEAEAFAVNYSTRHRTNTLVVPVSPRS